MTRPICPNCSKEYVVRVPKAGVLEHLLGIFYIYPFRCQLCRHRFIYLQKGVRYKRLEEDRREYERLALKFPVSFAGDHMTGEGTVCDISMGGCTFRTTALPVEGAIMSIALQISDSVQPVKVEAAVIRNIRQDRIGVEFLRFEPMERERLQHFIRGHLLSRAA